MCAGVGGVFVGRGRGEGVCGGIDCPISDGVLEVYYINRIIHLGPIPRNLLFKVEFENSFFAPSCPEHAFEFYLWAKMAKPVNALCSDCTR